MELVNELYDGENEISAPVMRDCLRDLVLILHPFAPYVTQELWEELGNDGAQPIFKHPWPPFDPELPEDQEIEIPVQVNGKLRSRILVPPPEPPQRNWSASPRPARRSNLSWPANRS